MPKLIIVVKEDTKEVMYGLACKDDYILSRKDLKTIQAYNIDDALRTNLNYSKLHQLEFHLEYMTEEQLSNAAWDYYGDKFGPYGVDPLVKIDPATQLETPLFENEVSSDVETELFPNETPDDF